MVQAMRIGEARDCWRAMTALTAAPPAPVGDPFAGLYVVWSNEHGAWWRANSAGYCTELLGAGLYTKEEAEAICARAANGREKCYLAAEKWRALVGLRSPGTVFDRVLATLPTGGVSDYHPGKGSHAKGDQDG